MSLDLATILQRTDLNNQNKPNQDFPIICSKCLGNNPYIRMIRNTNAEECKICKRVFTTHQWKRERGSRYSKTMICGVCATMKNLCQCCLTDLEFGIPQYVRDGALKDDATPSKETGGLYNAASHSHVSTIFKADLAEKTINEGGVNQHLVAHQRAASTDAILHKTRHNPFTLQTNVAQDKYVVLRAPQDPSIRTLYVGGLPNDTSRITEVDIRMHFAPYGPLKGVRMVPSQKCAFVTYVNREDAEIAAEALYNRLNVKGQNLKIMWAKPKEKMVTSVSNVTGLSSDVDMNDVRQLQKVAHLQRAPEEEKPIDPFEYQRQAQEYYNQLMTRNQQLEQELGLVPPKIAIPLQGLQVAPPLTGEEQAQDLHYASMMVYDE